jgi:REP-associated tyrosine transposase
MPNHVHGLLIVENEGGPPVTETVRAFKSFSAREINKTRAAGTKFAWQRGFHEHVARNEKDLAAIREYIQNNPVKWELDEENPARQRATALPQGGS